MPHASPACLWIAQTRLQSTHLTPLHANQPSVMSQREANIRPWLITTLFWCRSLACFFSPSFPTFSRSMQSATFSRKQAGSCKHGAKPAAARYITILLVAVFEQHFPGTVVGIKKVLLVRPSSSASQPHSCLLNQHVV